MEPIKQVVCAICGKTVHVGVEYSDAEVYHLRCIKYAPKVVEIRKHTQKLLPERAVSWEKPL